MHDQPNPSAALRRAVFINKDAGLLDPPVSGGDAIGLLFGAAAPRALAALASAGFVLVLTTNQGRLALGQLTRLQFARLQSLLELCLLAEAGVTLLDVMVCGHAPGNDGRPACLCRKPAPGMLTRAARMHRLDLEASWLVAESQDDVEAGRRANCRTVLLDGNHSAGQLPLRPLRRPDARAKDWDEAATLILHELAKVPDVVKPRRTGEAARAEPGGDRRSFWPRWAN